MRWKSPPRGDNETGWRAALARHGVHTLVGVVWAAIVWWLNPSYLWWLLPVVGALILSIPLSVLTSRAGARPQAAPAQVFPDSRGIGSAAGHPRDAALLASRAAAGGPRRRRSSIRSVNALVCAQAVAHPVHGWPREAIADALVERALHDGLDALTPADRNRLLADPAALSALHWAVWTSPGGARHLARVDRRARRPRAYDGRRTHVAGASCGRRGDRCPDPPAADRRSPTPRAR